jgi:hypothetical protein
VVEEGVITSFNHACVFVRYGAGQISKGTRREDLEWRRRDENTRPSHARPSRCRRRALPGTLRKFPIADIPAAIAAGWQPLPVDGWLLWPSTAPMALPA